MSHRRQNQPREILPVRAISDCMREDYRLEVVAVALRHYRDKKGPAPVRAKLESAMQGTVRLNGFRRPHLALSSSKSEELYAEVAAAFHYYSNMTGAVLQLWVDSNPELEADIRAFLASRGIAPAETFASGGGFSGPAPPATAQALNEFCRAHPDMNGDDAVLMFCCLTGYLPGGRPCDPGSDEGAVMDDDTRVQDEASGNNPISEDYMSSLKWADLLAELRHIPAAAAEWDEAAVSSFAESLRQLATAKRDERDRERNELRHALSRLMSEHGGRLALFELHDGSTWLAEECSASEAAGGAKRVKRLQELLDRYAGLGLAAPATVRERRSLEDEIFREHKALADIFAVPDAAPGGIRGDGQRSPGTAGGRYTDEPRGGDSSPGGIRLEEGAASLSALGAGQDGDAPGRQLTGIKQPTARPEEDGAIAGGELIETGEATTELPLQATGVSVAPPQTPAGDQSTQALGATPDVITPETSEDVQRETPHGRPKVNAGTAQAGEVRPEEGGGVARVAQAAVSASEVAVAEIDPQPLRGTVGADLPPVPTTDKDVYGPADSGPTPAGADAHSPELMWSLVIGGDLPGAYWFARSVSAGGHEPPAPASVLAALQGAWILKGPEDITALELTEITAQTPLVSGAAQALLRLAASLIPSLVAPATSGMSLWLEAPNFGGLESLVNAVKGFTKHRISLRVTNAHDIAGRDKRAEDFREVAGQAQAWLASAASGRTQHKRSSDVRAYLARNELRQLLEPVSQDRRSGAPEVRRLVNQWRDRRLVVEQINRVDRELVGLKVSQITGHPREQIIREVEEACEIALRWCELMERESLIETRGDWVSAQVTMLREGLRESLPDVEASIEALVAVDQPVEMRAAALCLRHSLAQVCRLVQIRPVAGEVDHPAASDWTTLNATSLRQVLSRRLKLLPGLALEDDGEPLPDTEAEIPSALRATASLDDKLGAAIEGWLRQQDFRFIPELIEAAERESHPVVATLKRRWRDDLAGSRDALGEALAKASDQIEQAIVDGIIGEARSGYSARLQKIDPDRTLNFGPAFAELQSILDDLNAEREKRRAKQESDWRQLQDRLSTAKLEDSEKARVEEVMRLALGRGDTRVVDEHLADLRETLDGNKELSANWAAPAAERDVLAEFTEALPRIEAWLQERQGLANVIADVRNGRAGAGIGFGGLPSTRLEESSAALDAWRQLRRLEARAGDREVAPHVTVILNRFLGFNLDSPSAGALRVKARGRDWIYLEASMTSGTLSPVPQFGSREDGRFAIVCLWERPSADTIGALLRDLRLAARSVLVFYVGRLGQRLGQRQRRELAHVCRRDSLSLAVLDEMLLIFLAGERGARLPTFLKCALPLSAINPYTPFQAGDVPPEMFFGRELMARDIQEPGGSCLVYGGRQFGKSALLRHVKREFHQQENERYAWVEDINVVGDPKGGRAPDVIWRRIRDRFKEAKLLDPHTSTDDPEAIYEKVRDVMRVPGRRVIVLFDEADHFLDADAKEGFKVVSDLRRLMAESQRRFKVVFAGLHNVYRFQGIPNQPLAHFGTPICVGPLEAVAAQALVKRPLQALGYSFKDQSGVLRILSYTNYHPGLIQLFCWELLRKLHARSGDQLPPYEVTQSDVESVYRIQKVRDDIRDRFDWTLALDKHYQAIAWGLIYEQVALSDNFARTFSQREVLKLAKDAWEKGFADVDDERLRGLLEEMCGLGVLVRTEGGEYRLRSPNLVRLVGSEEKILSDLVSLSEEEPEVTFDADSHHMLLDEGTHRYSPLTHAQERGLAPPKFGVGLVFASEALGLEALPDAFRKLVPEGTPPGTWLCEEVPDDQDTPALLSSWLNQCLNRNASKRRFVVWQRVTGPPHEAAARVEAAISVCRKREGRNRWMRVFFVFDPTGTWGWCQLPLVKRLELESRAGAVTSPRRWNLLGISQRLRQRELLDTKQVCEGILEATSGWPWLLDRLFDRFAGGMDPREAVDFMGWALAPGGELADGFKHALGVGGGGSVGRLLRFVAGAGESGAPVDLIVPDSFSDDDSALSAAECAAGIEFLKRMGCLEVRDDTAHVDALARQVLLVT
jgi:hypothetical protein